jgi:ankyrin repeat protein
LLADASCFNQVAQTWPLWYKRPYRREFLTSRWSPLKFFHSRTSFSQQKNQNSKKRNESEVGNSGSRAASYMDAAKAAKHKEVAEKLVDAVERQDAPAVKKLLSKPSFRPEALQAASYKGGKPTSPLHLASLNGSTEITQLLLAHGAPIDARDDQLYTPLLCAASQRHFALVRLLLDHGADPTLQNDSSSSVLHYLIRPGEDGAVTDEQCRMIEYCLESGSQINSRNKYGETPLIQAASKKQTDVCALLLKHGAKVNQTNSFGETALHKAATLGHLTLAKMLIEAGADPHIMSKHGKPRGEGGGSCANVASFHCAFRQHLRET